MENNEHKYQHKNLEDENPARMFVSRYLNAEQVREVEE